LIVAAGKVGSYGFLSIIGLMSYDLLPEELLVLGGSSKGIGM